MTLYSSLSLPYFVMIDFMMSFMNPCVSLALSPVAETTNAMFVSGILRVPSVRKEPQDDYRLNGDITKLKVHTSEEGVPQHHLS